VAAAVEVGPFSAYAATDAVLGKSPGATAIACRVSTLQVSFTGPVYGVEFSVGGVPSVV
jgi:hypothetical protein